MHFFKLGWVKDIKIEELKGITQGALRMKRQRGQIIEGVHWRKAADNVIYYNYEALDEYIENGYSQAS